MIYNHCVKKVKIISVAFFILGEICGAFLCSLPLFTDEREFPLQLWIPFEVKKSNYWIIYTWHTFFIFVGCSINTCSDCIFVHFIEHGCAQLKILSIRLKSIPEAIKSARKKNMKYQDILIIEKSTLRPLFIHHQLIYK